jgi:hypothetical protein
VVTKFLKIQLITLAAAAVFIFISSGSAAALGQYVSGSTGVDVSYPNCSASISKTSFGIVGVTSGRGFSGNPCLAAQASHFNNLSLYVNTGYPGLSYGLQYQNSPRICDANDLNCVAYNYGYNAGLYAVNYAQSQGVWSNTWWEDVETMNTWMTDAVQNQQSLLGERDALAAAGVTTIGAYSTTAQWGAITGGWQNLWPSWGATTWRTAKQAATYCTGHQFTGGPSYLMQYRGRYLDEDVAC